ncbi:hypothetical protein ACLKA6_000263 [Drosophila palustris]
MRAAPAPSEATAPASEDPPPTGMNLDTSPAVSGSSDCPAGPSDSLEDLAQDEDLADLTLDPAAVEEMNEQMAMSSQELHEELEGADVTLTPCDDEGNSRPPRWLLISCANKETAEWLKAAVPKLKLWTGAKVELVAEADMPKPQVY